MVSPASVFSELVNIRKILFPFCRGEKSICVILLKIYLHIPFHFQPSILLLSDFFFLSLFFSLFFFSLSQHYLHRQLCASRSLTHTCLPPSHLNPLHLLFSLYPSSLISSIPLPLISLGSFQPLFAHLTLRWTNSALSYFNAYL